MYAPTTENACIDFMQAAQVVSAGLGVEWHSRMLLVGFSQGGFSTSVVQRALEAAPVAGVDVFAAAGLASPLNLAGVVFPYAIEGAAESHSMYLAFLAHAYCRVYDQPLDTLLTAEYSRVVPNLFDGEHSADTIVARLPLPTRDVPPRRRRRLSRRRAVMVSGCLEQQRSGRLGTEGTAATVLRRQ